MAPGQLPPDEFADREVRDFLERLPRGPFSAMAAACLDRFGAARAWPRDKIIAYWRLVHPIRRGGVSPIEFEPDIRDFIDDRLGRMSFDCITEACRERFGDRAPSRSSIGRYSRSRCARSDRQL